MIETKFKYYRNALRLCLFKVVLLFSVFAFSGFNEKIQSAFNESVKTELVKPKTCKSVISLKKFTEVSFVPFLSHQKNYNSYALLNFNRSIAIRYKSLRKKNLSPTFSSIKLPAKTPLSSSEEETPPLSIG